MNLIYKDKKIIDKLQAAGKGTGCPVGGAAAPLPPTITALVIVREEARRP
jgi:hypothetical protein